MAFGWSSCCYTDAGNAQKKTHTNESDAQLGLWKCFNMPTKLMNISDDRCLAVSVEHSGVQIKFIRLNPRSHSAVLNGSAADPAVVSSRSQTAWLPGTWRTKVSFVVRRTWIIWGNAMNRWAVPRDSLKCTQYTTLCLKKGPTCKLSVTLSNLNRFSIFLHYWKAYKFATKPIQHYPPHLSYVATLHWEIRNSNFLQIFSRYGRKCKQMAF